MIFSVMLMRMLSIKYFIFSIGISVDVVFIWLNEYVAWIFIHLEAEIDFCIENISPGLLWNKCVWNLSFFYVCTQWIEMMLLPSKPLALHLRIPQSRRKYSDSCSFRVEKAYPAWNHHNDWKFLFFQWHQFSYLN